nr:hypothetical protein [Solirubrobacterales bacterium]
MARSLKLTLLPVLLLVLLGTAAAAEPVSAEPRYTSLRSVGVGVRSASLERGRVLRVKITVRRPVAVRFAIVRDGKQLGSAKRRVARGTTTLKL